MNRHAARRIAALPAEATALFLGSGIRSIDATLLDADGNRIAGASDGEIVREDEPYVKSLTASIGGGGFQGFVGMGVSGFFGVDAFTNFPRGSLSTEVLVLGGYRNDDATPLCLTASFIVVDCLLDLVGGPGDASSDFYRKSIAATSPGEIARWQFLDPGATTSLPSASVVTATPVAVAMSTPATISLRKTKMASSVGST
jgi:hypothetical protein